MIANSQAVLASFEAYMAAYSATQAIGVSVAGFTSGLVASGGDLQAGFQGAVSASLFSLAGGLQGFEQMAGHAVAGCASGAISGGGCGSGALSAVVAKGATIGSEAAVGTLGVSPEARIALHFTATVVAGGTASTLAGGKFDNGAATAAFGYLFNHVSSEYNRSTGTLTVTDVDTGLSVTAQYFSGSGAGDQVPTGNYAVLEGTYKNGQPRFRLEPLDAVFGDDTHHVTGRNLFRLHGPSRSSGCITACDAANWAPVRNVIQSTATSWVNVIRYKSVEFFGYRVLAVPVGIERLRYYGTLRVE
jgi:hypothetical protein